MDNFFRNWTKRREIGGISTVKGGVPETTDPNAASNQPTVRGGSYQERIVYARLTISAVYRALEMRADTFAMMPVQYQRKDSEGGNFVPWMYGIGKRMNYLLQEEPNPIMSAADLWKQVVINRQQLGNGFVYVERDTFGDPVHLWLAWQYAAGTTWQTAHTT